MAIPDVEKTTDDIYNCFDIIPTFYSRADRIGVTISCSTCLHMLTRDLITE